MPKTGISITIEEANLLWLKSRTLARKGRSLSETLDDLVTAARTGGPTDAAAVRSVQNTVDIADDDPDLERADDYLGGLVNSSLSKPFLARERPPVSAAGGARKKTPRG
jgi:hypothetical protein